MISARSISPRCFVLALFVFCWGCDRSTGAQDTKPDATPTSAALAQKILEGARREVRNRTLYHESYEVIKYPGGDVSPRFGVCTDLVIRAFRNAGVDLQKELHEDRVAHPEAYPTKIWPNKRADKNIDHRRCQNLVVWFRRFAKSLSTSTDPETLKKEWQPGDVVFFVRAGQSHPWHVAIVSDRRDPDGMPRIIDNYPPWTSESHRLDTFAPIHSHFRFKQIKPSDDLSSKEKAQ